MNIYTAISNVMSEIGAISKDKKNPQQGFMYRGVDDVMNALQPALTKYKVFIVPEILEQTREERTTSKGGNLIYSICKVKYTFYADDGSSVSATVIGEGMDSGDKATNKAMSIAFKYACFQVFCIPTEEMKDPDAESHEIESLKPQNGKPSSNDSNKPKNDKAAKYDTITTKQAARLFTIAKGESKEQKAESVKMIISKYGYENTKDISIADYPQIVEDLESMPLRKG